MATSDARARAAEPDVRISLLVTLVLLVLTDVALHAWSPNRARIPAHFSSAYLARYAAQAAHDRGVLVLGDSELWGYGLSASEAPVARIARAIPDAAVDNFTFQAQTPINADFVVRYLLAHGVRPRGVLLEVNQGGFNQTAREYDTLNAALANEALPSLVAPFDRGRLDQGPARRTTLADRIDRFVADRWLLYASRADIHQALFGDADLATALSTRLGPYLQPPAPPRTAGAYARLYDLTPLDGDNVSYAYLGHALELLAQHGIPVLVLLAPVNHALLHAAIDNRSYAENVRRVEALARAHGARVVNADALVPGDEFLDNTHLNAAGADRLARILSPSLRRLLDVLQ